MDYPPILRDQYCQVDTFVAADPFTDFPALRQLRLSPEVDIYGEGDDPDDDAPFRSVADPDSMIRRLMDAESIDIARALSVKIASSEQTIAVRGALERALPQLDFRSAATQGAPFILELAARSSAAGLEGSPRLIRRARQDSLPIIC